MNRDLVNDVTIIMLEDYSDEQLIRELEERGYEISEKGE